MFDVEATKVTEFSLLFSAEASAERDYERERRLLCDGRDLYECGRLRHITEHPATDGDDIVEADVMDEANERVREHVAIRVKASDRPMEAGMITGMSCTCTPHDVPRCVHACAVCFRLFYRHRYEIRDAYTGRAVIPHEASDIVARYMADRLGTWFPDSDEDAAAMAKGLEIITGFDKWEQWIGNDHVVRLMGNCMPTVEESIDMYTQFWPKHDEPDLTSVLPHGWFTMLEAAYEKLGDRANLAKAYAVYIAQSRLPQDARYVDRLRWLLGDTAELTDMVDELTGGFQPARGDRMRPVVSLAYEHLLREFGLSDEAVAYCESLRKYDERCARRLSDTIAIDHANRMEDLETTKTDWNTHFGKDDVDRIVWLFRMGLERHMPAFFANGYVDPIVEDCEALIRAAAAGSRARCRLLVSQRFPEGERATVARDLLRRVGDLIDPESDRAVIPQRAIAMVEPCAEPLARTFLIDDDVVVFAPPLDETVLRTERPRDFTEALRLIDDIDGLPLVHDEADGGEQDIAIVERALKARIERAKTEARFGDIVSAAADDADGDASQAKALEGLRSCLDVQIDALFGTRFSLDSAACDDLFDPPVTMGQRNKWLRPTAGQLGVWTAMFVLNVKRHEHTGIEESVHLPHYLAAKGLKNAMIAMLDHMLGVTAMLGISRSQVDMDEWDALHLLRIDPHPDTVDAHGHTAMLRPDGDFTVPYMTDVLRHVHPDMNLIDAYDERAVRGTVDHLRMMFAIIDGHDGVESDGHVEYARKEAADTALALVLAALEDPDGVPPLIDDPETARAAAEQAKQAYMMFWQARDENDSTPADDDDEISGHEADITDAGNMMLFLLERTYTRLMDIAEPGYKDW